MPDLIGRILFTIANILTSALIICCYEYDLMVLAFVFSCLLVMFNGAVIDCVYKHGNSKIERGRW